MVFFRLLFLVLSTSLNHNDCDYASLGLNTGVNWTSSMPSKVELNAEGFENISILKGCQFDTIKIIIKNDDQLLFDFKNLDSENLFIEIEGKWPKERLIGLSEFPGAFLSITFDTNELMNPIVKEVSKWKGYFLSITIPGHVLSTDDASYLAKTRVEALELPFVIIQGEIREILMSSEHTKVWSPNIN